MTPSKHTGACDRTTGLTRQSSQRSRHEFNNDDLKTGGMALVQKLVIKEASFLAHQYKR
jgi:hypothetical protein